MEVYAGAVLAGVAATVTPCVLPLYPAFLVYLTAGGAPAGSSAGVAAGALVSRPPPLLAALLVWAGVVAGMLLIGVVVASLAVPFADVNRVILPLADLLLIVLGVLLVIGVNPFARLPQPSLSALGRAGPVAGAFLYGVLFAPIAIPCSGPFLVGIFAFSLTIGDAIGRIAFFGLFGVGFGLPLFLLGSAGQARGAQLARAIVRYERPLQLVLGVALIAVGVWDFAENASLILR